MEGSLVRPPHSITSSARARIGDGHRCDSSPKIKFAPDSPLEGIGFGPSVPPRTERPWESPKSILAISDLTLAGSTDRADVPIGNAQQSLLQQRDGWFESGSLQRRVSNEPSADDFPEARPTARDDFAMILDELS
jgi:hypothetical protein